MNKLLLNLVANPYCKSRTIISLIKLFKILMEEFMISHHKSTTYYPQTNEQVKSTNKRLGKILTKLVNVNQVD
jgi:hypothetical protein